MMRMTMASLTAPNSGGNDRPTIATVTNEDIRTWERDLLEALRATRHHVDWGTGSVMDHESPPPMLVHKVEAHSAITEAEEFIDRIVWLLRDFISDRDSRPPGKRPPAFPEARTMALLEALEHHTSTADEALREIRETLADLQPERVPPAR